MLSRRAIEGPLRERALRGISEAARRQARLIEDLLDVARIASGKMRLERTFVDLADVIRDALLIAQPSAAMKQIRLSFDGGPWIGRGSSAIASGSQQVASNLISNAVKFTPDGGVVDVRMRRVGDHAELVVSDSGQGIAAEFLPSVFELFRQADGSTTRMHSGWASACRSSRAWSRRTTERSRCTAPAKGWAPRSSSRSRSRSGSGRRKAAGASERAASAAMLPSLAGIRVLVVDDDEESRDVVAAHLHGCHAAVSDGPFSGGWLRRCCSESTSMCCWQISGCPARTAIR